METGQVETGRDNHDTYLKILQQVIRITPKEAHGIAAKYPTIIELFNAFEQHGSLVLEDLKVY
jgi:crossover junction endonuclease EME1